MENISLIFVLGVMALLFWLGTSKRGKSLFFTGRIVKTFDGAHMRHRMITNDIKVHVLDAGPVRFVGLEIVAKSFASYQMTPLTLPAAEARQLAQMLLEAVDYQE
ncbi:hypothetical protein [Vogesella indigofera]|uniref:hypothetical protein n=1 Tax=Vogesella indigofera TaxID=45465 RepID=UPI00234F7461|nr:hypothetical protein [Vogesella indigofera]MDC7700913.1 hypothetical protein [Vogesella indigofera]